MIYLVILGLLGVNLVILNIWIRIFDHIFHLQKQKKKIIIFTIGMGLISGLSIVFYPTILEYLHFATYNFTDLENLKSFSLLLIFWGYLTLIIIIIKIFGFSLIFTFNFLIQILLFLGLFFLFGYVGFLYFTEMMLIYYIFVALGEEYIKFALGLIFFEKWKILDNDILLFSILSGIGFAFVENIIYMFGGISGIQYFGLIITNGVQILLFRGIIGILVHLFFTGNIGLFYSLGFGYQKIWLYSILGIIIGVGSHYIYDILIYLNFKFIIVLFLFFGYFWISYLFYRSDRVYLQIGLESNY